THKFFQQNDFLYIQTPIITASDCEGAGELFQVTNLNLEKLPKDKPIDYKFDFFDKPTFLTVSGQLNAEALACALSDVYTFSPTFRAENSNTSRHLAEFWMIEPEMAFADLNDVKELAENYLKFIFNEVLQTCPKDMEFFNQFIDKGLIDRLQKIISTPFTHMTYTKAVEILENSGKKFEFPVSWGKDLQSEHERYLSETHCKSPVIVTDYPKEIKAFYMRDNDDGKTVAALDILVPNIGEIIGGSQREERLDLLQEKILKNDLDPKHMQWYLDLRKYGTVPHGGFGAGFERLVQFVTGMENIRDVIPFPRTPGHADY
ncbi:MAG: asparagine--tRNA ligase, partial [Simkaniaceae bacterium]|nr:asparagine--tRNA ligase [Simkaniaceae bacterium]